MLSVERWVLSVTRLVLSSFGIHASVEQATKTLAKWFFRSRFAMVEPMRIMEEVQDSRKNEDGFENHPLFSWPICIALVTIGPSKWKFPPIGCHARKCFELD